MSDEIANCLSGSPGAPATPMDDDDLLWEILLRLLLLPSSLPRASSVCTRWRRLVTDPRVLRSFRDHHRKEGPPILGFFEVDDQELVFNPILDPPDRVAFHIDFRHCALLGCRHGHVLIVDSRKWDLVVCASVTGEQQRVPIPTEFLRGCVIGSVMCAATDLGHLHGACHSSHFKVVLLSAYVQHDQTIARVYSSETGAWGNLISAVSPYQKFKSGCRVLLAGNKLYWLSKGDTLIELDLEEQSLAVVMMAPGTKERLGHRQLILAENGTVGFAVLSYPRFQTWQRNVNSRGVATWVPWKTIRILGLPPQIESPRMKTILCYGEDTDTIFIDMDGDVYMVQLKSMQSKRIYGTDDDFNFYPFMSFYPPSTSITSGGAKMLHHR